MPSVVLRWLVLSVGFGVACRYRWAGTLSPNGTYPNSEGENMEATPKPNKTETEPRTWRSMSDLHIDITEALEVGKAPEAIAAEFPIDLALVLVVAEEIGVSS